MNSQTLRLLDANFNRAREALRVLEDYARFVLSDRRICSELKQMRHGFTSVASRYIGDAILHRDTPHDVGTNDKTSTEVKRGDIADVVTAAGKRLGEALRTIEEYLKIESPPDAAEVEKLRYRFYDIEHRLSLCLFAVRRDFSRVRLYVLITESACKKSPLEVAEQAIAGGADCLQFREKNRSDSELLRLATLFAFMCRNRGVISIINDRPDVAILSGADGVHLGQDDLPARDVRKLLGPDKIVGVSTHNLDQAKRAVLDGADYIGVGPVFRSGTKPREWATIPGLEFAREAAASVKIPTVAIAGITLQNVDEVLATGVQAVAVTAAVAGADDPRAAAEQFKERMGNGCPSTQQRH